ncbi:TALE-type homeodomain protein [Melampsora americana]|nr:TALE-type homeodomain protein [Melampsora americana]
MALHSASFEHFKSSERSFFAACAGDQPIPLPEFAAELDARLQNVERAYTGLVVSPGAAREYVQAATNIQVLASTMSKVHCTFEAMMEDFVQKLSLAPAARQEPAVGCAAKSQDLSADTASTPTAPPPVSSEHEKDPHDFLRDWSGRHLSYLFPSKQELLDLSGQTGLSTKQVDLWFRNARTRSGWSKLFTNKLYANKDRQKLESYFSEYELIRKLHGTKAGSVISSDDGFKLIEKVLKWFRVKKPRDTAASACPIPSVSEETSNGSVSPWVKDVLFSTLASLRTTSTPSPSKKTYLPASGWPNFFNRTHSLDIDPSLRSSSPASSSEATLSCSSVASSSTWSSVSTSPSRSSSPCSASSSSSPQRSPRPQSISSSPSPPLTSPSPSAPSLFPFATFSPEPLSQLTSSPPESSTCLSPQPDPSTSLLSFLCSDSFSPPSPTHEPCSIAPGQFDDAEED